MRSLLETREVEEAGEGSEGPFASKLQRGGLCFVERVRCWKAISSVELMRLHVVTLITTALTYAMNATSSSTCRLPRLVAFDLDGTIWSPDMYQLWGGGSPFRVDGDGTKQLYDQHGTKVKLLGVSSKVLQELKTDPRWLNTKTAWVSCTDEPSWADECMTLFKTAEGKSLKSYIDSSQIFKANKKEHFRRLKKEFPDIEYPGMCIAWPSLHTQPHAPSFL